MMDPSQTSRDFGSIHAQSNLQKIQSEVFFLCSSWNADIT